MWLARGLKKRCRFRGFLGGLGWRNRIGQDTYMAPFNIAFASFRFRVLGIDGVQFNSTFESSRGFKTHWDRYPPTSQETHTHSRPRTPPGHSSSTDNTHAGDTNVLLRLMENHECYLSLREPYYASSTETSRHLHQLPGTEKPHRRVLSSPQYPLPSLLASGRAGRTLRT